MFNSSNSSNGFGLVLYGWVFSVFQRVEVF